MSQKTENVCWNDRRLGSPHSQADKARRVRHMFDAIAPTYERINYLASFGRDGYWRKKMVRLARVRPDDLLLDVACGTGDVARAFCLGEKCPQRILGLDFSLPMLELAGRRKIVRSDFCQADALKLPVADESVSIVSCAFGIRNFQDLGAGLREMYRVLCVGGRAIILEFCVPRRPLFRRLYLFYFRRVMPALATIVARDSTGAYRYLPSSVLSFQGPDRIISELTASGFSQVSAYPLTWGIVTIYVATKVAGKK